ncbi:uncharacterized protein LOC117338821 [Pecten maximus]|uniref:uncharacterized protein LOC117338821 n=1 Tax=Pecten maximus TaxID=6579 RepID=UPI0014589A55|nr:uncharacterized protein LOC117338821 [Pecten maximus]
MICLLKIFTRNFLQCKQLHFIQIISASRAPFHNTYMLQERQKVLETNRLKKKGHQLKWNMVEIVKHSSVLDCKPEDMLRLAKINEKKYGNSWDRTVSKVYALKQHGFSVPQMIDHHRMFSLGNKKLNTILDMIRSEPSGMYMPPVEFGTSDRWLFRYFLYAKNNSKKKPMSCVYVWKRSVTNKENVLKFFKSKGITFSEEDIAKYDKTVNGICYEKLVALLAHAAEFGVTVEELDLKEIYNFCNYKRIFPKSRTKLHCKFYEYLKDHHVDSDLKDLVLQHEEDVTENLKVLMSRGFSFEDIVSCPVVACHSPEILLVYLNSLHERKELWPMKRLTTDKKKVLNMIQYYIERNHRFSMQVVKTESHAFLCYELNISSQ